MKRQTRAFLAALALHVIAAVLLSRMPVPSAARVPASRTIALEWTASPRAPATAKPIIAPAITAATTPRSHTKRPAPVAAPASHAAATSEPPSPPTETPAPEAAPPSRLSPRGAAGPPELFPRAVLEELAARSPGPPPPARAPPATEHDRETPGGWLDDAAAEARTRTGQVDHVWREIERQLVQSFKPSIDVVHEEPSRKFARIVDHLKSYVNQAAGVVARGEEGLRHPVEPGAHDLAFGVGGSIDPSNQGFQGVPEGMNLRSQPLAQQQAVVAATGDPASWLEVEIEITVDGAGNVTRARVAMPSGRRVFDRYALRMVQERVAQNTPPSSLSRWVCRAGYAVAPPAGIAVDVLKLFSRKTAKDALLYPLKARVEARVALKWVKEIK